MDDQPETERRPCDRCGAPVTEEEVAGGLAVQLGEELVCPACVDVLPATTQLRINQIRAFRGMDTTTYRVVDSEHPETRYYTFTNVANLIRIRRRLRDDPGFQPPTLPRGKSSAKMPGARSAPRPAASKLRPMFRLPRPTRYLLFVAGVLLGGIVAVLLLPRGDGGDPAEIAAGGGEETPAEEETGTPGRWQALRGRLETMSPTEAWRAAKAIDNCPPEILADITVRLTRRKEADLEGVEEALAEPHYSRARELLERTPLPIDLAFADLRQRERRLHARLDEALSSIAPQAPPEEEEPETPPPDGDGEEETPPEVVEARLPPGEEPTGDGAEEEDAADGEETGGVAKKEPPDDGEAPAPPPPDPSELPARLTSGRDLRDAETSGWEPVDDGLLARGRVAVLSRKLRLPAGEWTVFVQGRCPSDDAAITVTLGDAAAATEDAITPQRSTWLSFALVHLQEEHGPVEFGLATLGREWFVKRVLFADARIEDPGAVVDGTGVPSWVAPPGPPPEAPPVVTVDLAGAHQRFDHASTARLFARFYDHRRGRPGRILERIFAELPGGVPAHILASDIGERQVDGRRRNQQMLEVVFDPPLDTAGGGLALLLHPNRRSGREFLVELEDTRSHRWSPGKSVAIAENTWTPVLVDVSGFEIPEDKRKRFATFDPNRVARLRIADVDPDISFPFYLAKVAARADAPIADDDLGILPTRLDNTSPRALAEILEQVGEVRHWGGDRAIAREFDPTLARFLVGHQVNESWRTALRQRLVPFYDGAEKSGDLPRGLITDIVIQDAWLDAEFIEEHLRSHEHHVVVVMTAGVEFHIGLDRAQALRNFWDKMAAEARRSGFLPVVVLGPSKVDPQHRDDADALWDELAAHVAEHHPGLPVIDLRPVEAEGFERFAAGMRELSLDLMADGYRELVEQLAVAEEILER